MSEYSSNSDVDIHYMCLKSPCLVKIFGPKGGPIHGKFRVLHDEEQYILVLLYFHFREVSCYTSFTVLHVNNEISFFL